jgi:cytochrome bd-type quinol oxidase subunit 2
MIDKILCNPANCLPSTIYLVAQSIIIVFMVSLILGMGSVLKRNVENGKIYRNMSRSYAIMYLVISIIIIALIYVLINYLCKINMQVIAWLIALLPFLGTFIIGFNASSIFVNMIKQN